MSTGDISLTIPMMRDLLDQVEAGPLSTEQSAGEQAAGSVGHVGRLRDAQRLVRAAESLLAETVADARAVPHAGTYLTIGDGYGYTHTVITREQTTADRSPARYGWEVIAWSLGCSTAAAHKKFRGTK